MRSFNAIIKQVAAFLAICVVMISWEASASVESEDLESYDLFLGIQCQVWADYGGLDEAATAYWEKNANTFNDAGLSLYSFDVSYIVNTQFDHAISRMVRFMERQEITEIESAVMLYSRYCQYL